MQILITWTKLQMHSTPKRYVDQKSSLQSHIEKVLIQMSFMVKSHGWLLFQQ